VQKAASTTCTTCSNLYIDNGNTGSAEGGTYFVVNDDPQLTVPVDSYALWTPFNLLVRVQWHAYNTIRAWNNFFANDVENKITNSTILP
jgi:hypothetical protein